MINLITILGCTATGKTKLAVSFAGEFGGEIISADSRQVYRGMDIGTGKDLQEYVYGGKPVGYHLIDIADPGQEYNLFEFQKDFSKAFRDIESRKRLPVLCGGTGMYLDAVLRRYPLQEVPEDQNLREELNKLTLSEITRRLQRLGAVHNTTDLLDRKRAIRALEIARFQSANPGFTSGMPAIESLTFGIEFDRQVIRERITRRLEMRLQNGLIGEVKVLLESGLTEQQLTFYGLEYRYVTLHAVGKMSYEEMFGKLNTAIHQFAKRQRTWFRRMEKKGVLIHWLDGTLTPDENLRIMAGIMAQESPQWLPG